MAGCLATYIDFVIKFHFLAISHGVLSSRLPYTRWGIHDVTMWDVPNLAVMLTGRLIDA